MADRRPYNRTVIGRSNHGQTRTPLYRIWGLIKVRCTNPRNPSYAHYGGRGITICERWSGSFLAFADDMGPRPTKDHQVDRIDNDGPYSPENCRWATRSEQARNRRDTHLFEHDGLALTLPEWSERTGIKRSTLSMRIYVRGWDVERTLTTPVMGGGRHR